MPSSQMKSKGGYSKKSYGGSGSGSQGSLRVLPHSIDAEEGLIASCILDGGLEVLNECIEKRISEDSFFKPAHKFLFEALKELYEENIPVDEIVLFDKLQKLGHDEDVGGLATINRITDRIETVAHASHWLEIVREKALLRSLIKTSSGLIEKCYTHVDDMESFLGQAEQDIFKISQGRIVDAAQHIKGPIESAAKMVNLLLQKKHSGFGLRSGLKDLDAMTFGFHPTQMIVLAARPSVGKTSLAMNFVERAIIPHVNEGDPANVLVFSLEMGADQLAMRMLCGRAGVDMEKLRTGFSDKEQSRNLAQAAKELQSTTLWIDDSGHLTISELRAKARRVDAKHKLGLVVIDYLQLIAGSDNRMPREQQIAEISRNLKGMSKELNLPVIVLSQLNRASEKDNRDPRLSDLRESGSIEQDADVVFLLHRTQNRSSLEDDGNEQFDPNFEPIKLIVAKQRNGPTGEVPLTFIRNLTKFENAAKDYASQ